MCVINKVRWCFVAVLAVICLTSCVDYTQSISLKDGKYTVYIKFTLSKTLFAMADQDADEWVDKLLEDENEVEALRKVSTDVEVGAEGRFVIDAKTRDADEKAILPVISKTKVLLPFLPREAASGLKTDDEDTNDMTAAILSSAKCRILVGKNIISKIDSAYFAGKGGQNYSIAVFDYGEVWGIEVPFLVLMETSMYDFDNIVLIKG